MFFIIGPRAGRLDELG